MSPTETVNIQDDYLKRGVGFSLLAHIIVLCLFLFNIFHFKTNKIDLSQAIRVDMVGLPDKVLPNSLPEKKEPKAEIEKPEAKSTVVEKLPEKAQPAPPKSEPNTVNLNKSKNKQKEALEKLKKLSAIEKIKRDLKTEEQQKAIQQELAKNLAKGRVVSAGTALTGLDKLEAAEYETKFNQQISEHWALPQWLMNKPYKASVLVKIDADGKIISRHIEQTSGVKSFDDYCIQAVDQAAPFPPVPEKLTEKYRVDGFEIIFPK